MRRSYKGYTIYVDKLPDRPGWSWRVAPARRGGPGDLLQGEAQTARQAGQAGRRAIDERIREKG